MGRENAHDPVKLVVPVLYSDLERYGLALRRLKAKFGAVDHVSEAFDFTFSGYYDAEMGRPITRVILSFEKLVRPERLVKIKRITNRIETVLAVGGKRKVNLDPGYLELGKFVLATTKDQQHRLYVGKGIYEEITLFFRDKAWRDWEWTYPDYRSEKYKKILTDIREIYKKQIGKGH